MRRRAILTEKYGPQPGRTPRGAEGFNTEILTQNRPPLPNPNPTKDKNAILPTSSVLTADNAPAEVGPIRPQNSVDLSGGRVTTPDVYNGALGSGPIGLAAAAGMPKSAPLGK